ncbi:MAG: ABC transporter ATP-binding protein [bacterium]|uniref:ABC transporter ATP-binding protein n=1 Tax=Candidatus Methylomirabilis tolerans TaxID=3123416 RepID=A0AAJ1AHT2_9BACT|nr:ABC transporter ATP-binding protein [Candidatus Methylomirabilis sp.]
MFIGLDDFVPQQPSKAEAQLKEQAQPIHDVAVALSNLQFAYPGRPQLLEIGDMEVQSGSTVSILGPSGCGKTTLLFLVAGFLTPRAGKVSLFGKTPNEVRGAGYLGIVFQNPTLLPWRTVVANIGLPFQLRQLPIDTDAVIDALSLVGLENWADAYPDELSGGMQSRVALARALATRPRLLLLDEAFGNLDEFHRLKLNLALSEIQRALKMTVLFVTHNVHDAVLISDRILVLQPPNSDGGPTMIYEDIRIDFANKTVDSISTTAFQALYQRLLSKFRAGVL